MYMYHCEVPNEEERKQLIIISSHLHARDLQMTNKSYKRRLKRGSKVKFSFALIFQ